MSNDNPFQKNMELWQQFSESYTKNMFAMFEKNLEHSRAFQEQVQAAVTQAVEAQFEMVMSSLKVMEEQISEISTTVTEATKAQPNGKKTKSDIRSQKSEGPEHRAMFRPFLLSELMDQGASAGGVLPYTFGLMSYARDSKASAASRISARSSGSSSNRSTNSRISGTRSVPLKPTRTWPTPGA